MDDRERQIALLEEEIGRHLDPFVQAIGLLDPVPGCNPISWRARLAEIGTDMAQFPTAQPLCRGACVRAIRRVRADAKRGTRAQAMAGYEDGCIKWPGAAAHTKDTYVWAQFRRLRRHRGEKRALLAGAHSLLTVIWHRLKYGTEYRALGADYFDRLEPRRLERQAVARLERLGFVVTLQKKSA